MIRKIIEIGHPALREIAKAVPKDEKIKAIGDEEKEEHDDRPQENDAEQSVSDNLDPKADADKDNDSDGIFDLEDAFPFDPDETVDSDLDGVGNNADTDDDNDGVLDVAHLTSLLGPKTKLLAFTHVSNALGTINPVTQLVALARDRGITTLVDGAQVGAYFAAVQDALRAI